MNSPVSKILRKMGLNVARPVRAPSGQCTCGKHRSPTLGPPTDSPTFITENPKEYASTEQYMSDVTSEAVDLSLFTLHSVARWEVEAYPS